MAKRLGSLKRQITQALIRQKRFGESKHSQAFSSKKCSFRKKKNQKRGYF